MNKFHRTKKLQSRHLVTKLFNIHWTRQSSHLSSPEIQPPRLKKKLHSQICPIQQTAAGFTNGSYPKWTKKNEMPTLNVNTAWVSYWELIVCERQTHWRVRTLETPGIAPKNQRTPFEKYELSINSNTSARITLSSNQN
jgi:hypothetical protein